MLLAGFFDRRLSRAARSLSKIGARGAVWHPPGSLPLPARRWTPPVADGARRRLGRLEASIFLVEHKLLAPSPPKRCRFQPVLLASASPAQYRLLEAQLSSD